MKKSTCCVLFHKPYGVFCQFTDSQPAVKRTTLKDYIPIPEIYAVGRLDLAFRRKKSDAVFDP